MKRLLLKKGEEKRLRAGHLWIFSNEIQEAAGAPATGDVVDLFDNAGRFLGRGFYNPHSLIAFRLLTHRPEEIDRAFWKARIEEALALRRRFYPGAASYRAVFGESDALPGLIVDKYGPCCAVQFLSAGMDRSRADIVAALNDLLQCEGIIARNDSSLRALEGLPEEVAVLSGNVPESIVIEDSGGTFAVHPHRGQKTGFYFDQRENRLLLARYCSGRRMLDGFCHSGAFGIVARKAGARSVTWVDSSGPALELARENARLNGIGEDFNGEEADVFEYLASLTGFPGKFDIINIDPPALIKSRKHFQAGYKAYRRLNAAALSALEAGGILSTSSCSHHLGPEDFRRMLSESAARAGKQVRLLEQGMQAHDHPVLLSMPETEYLKFAIIEVVA